MLPITTFAVSDRPFEAASARVVRLLAAAIDQRVSPDSTVWGTAAPAGAESARAAAAVAVMRDTGFRTASRSSGIQG